ncbi:MAG TPA: fibronectin-binding domain-containing protein [Methanoregulaceae archaeon]|nr:fibronectin-binding domain-containing protein [Methanoregulaceae archaeon]
MATAQGMSGVDLLAVVADLRRAMPLWIGKVYQYDQKLLGIRLNGQEHARYHLLIESGRRLHRIRTAPEPPKLPSSFAMLLRKHLEGGRVLAVEQHGLERIVSFEIGRKDTSYHLVFELFDEGNVVLCDADWVIVKPLWHHRFRDREVVPGAEYTLKDRPVPIPPAAPFASLLAEADRDLVRTLAVGLRLGGPFAEEVCVRAGVDRSAMANAVDPAPVYAALESLIRDVVEHPAPVLAKKGAWPIPLAGMKVEATLPSFDEALEALYPHAPPKAAVAKQEELSREERIRRQQVTAVVGFEAKIARYERLAEVVYEQYTLAAEVITTLATASRTRSWQEIAQVLKTADNPVAKRIVRVDPATASVEVDLGEHVTLYVHETVEQNVERLYDQAKKFKKKRAGALAAMAAAPPKAAPKAAIAAKRAKPRWYHRFRWFETSDGALVLGGRDAGQNEELVKRYMEGNDTFVHADVHGASVVIVKGPTERWDEVAQFAASFSGAWRAGHLAADVYAARPDQVSKTPEAGEYVGRGSFIVRGERTWFRSVPLGVAIGYGPAGVVGGPPSAVAPRAEVQVVLRPGPFEPNDTARQVLRTLREHLGGDGGRSAKAVLNTEAVARFVPPGGSEVAAVHAG